MEGQKDFPTWSSYLLGRPYSPDGKNYDCLAILNNITPGNSPDDPLVVPKWIWKLLQVSAIIPIMYLKSMHSVKSSIGTDYYRSDVENYDFLAILNNITPRKWPKWPPGVEVKT